MRYEVLAQVLDCAYEAASTHRRSPVPRALPPATALLVHRWEPGY